VTARRRRVGALVAGVLVASGCGDGDGAAGRLPAVTLPALAGGGPSLELAELDGPAVVNLWATWCEPCRRELPDFQAASDDHPGVRFVGVDIGEETARAQAFLDELGVTFEQYADVDGELADQLGVASLPVTIVIDDERDIATRHLGPMSRDQLDEALAEL
jgi:cytochrome c biogenesis protein CcmG, thiol:disulfide interchange protein DsbE